MLRLGASKHLYLASLTLSLTLSRVVCGEVCGKAPQRVSVPQSLSISFFPRVFSDMQARVRSQGFHASVSHLWSHPYFPTSHKVPDILIAGTTHQMPFVAEREILACEEPVWAEYCTVKT